MENWSPRFDKCANCSTKRFPHRSRGYCQRCYRSIKRLEEIEQWDFAKPTTLKHYPREPLLHKPDTFKKMKKGYSKRYQARLNSLKYAEEILSKPIAGIILEHKIQEVANLAGVHRNSLFFHTANSFDHNFNKEQKKIIYGLLNTITENIKWRGVDLYEVLAEKA